LSHLQKSARHMSPASKALAAFQMVPNISFKADGFAAA
jgi:hypothetical protein